MRRLEDSGFAVEPAELGTRLLRDPTASSGSTAASRRRVLAALAAVGAGVGCAGRGQPRVASPPSRRRSVARAGQVLVVADGDQAREFLAPLPLARCSRSRRAGAKNCRNSASRGSVSWQSCPVRRSPSGSTRTAGRLDARAREGRATCRGPPPTGQGTRRTARLPGSGREREPLRRALDVLVDRLLARAPPATAASSASSRSLPRASTGGGSWPGWMVTLRSQPVAERDRLRAALLPSIAELPAPAHTARVEQFALRRLARRRACSRRPRGRGPPGTAEGRPPPGARQHRRRRGVHRRRHRSVVTAAGTAGTAGSQRRVNAPRPALVEAHADGAPRRVNRQGVAVAREEWRVVDRWWTEEPVQPPLLRGRAAVRPEHRRLP